MQNERPRKLQRISQACDLCHRRSIRCRPSNEDGDRCQNCYDFDVACTYDRPSKRKKHPQAPAAPRDPNASVSTVSSNSTGQNQSSVAGPSTTFPLSRGRGSLPDYVDSVAGQQVSPATARIDLVNHTQEGKSAEHGAFVTLRASGAEGVDVAWKAFALASKDVIIELFNIFMQIIYPLYPLVDGPTAIKSIEQGDHLNDRGLFAATMAVCALTSARVRDGAYYGTISEELRRPETSSEVFFAAGKESLGDDYGKMNHADYIRACALLALACIQYRSSEDVQQYLGKAFTLAAMYKFYDEKNWPSEIDETQRELYRRVYWCTYTLDVYSATVWHCFLRSQEIHSYVRYPDDSIEADAATNLSPQSTTPVSWVMGLNFSLDLYRVLEHVLNKYRARKFSHDDRRSVDNLVFSDTFKDRDVMQTMLNMYYELPRQFKETPDLTGNMEKDRFGFQAANIQATMQLLRMMLFSLEDGPGVDRKCDVANEVLQVFHTIPLDYLKAISLPLIYQIASIGQLLGSILEEPVEIKTYQRARDGVASLAGLLTNLEEALHRPAGLAETLSKQVDMLDEYIRKHTPPQGHPPPNMNQRQPMSMGPGIGDPSPDLPLISPPTIASLPGPPEMHADWPYQFFENASLYPGHHMGPTQW